MRYSLSAVRLDRLLFIIKPATENMHSTGTDDADDDRSSQLSKLWIINLVSTTDDFFCCNCPIK